MNIPNATSATSLPLVMALEWIDRLDRAFLGAAELSKAIQSQGHHALTLTLIPPHQQYSSHALDFSRGTYDDLMALINAAHTLETTGIDAVTWMAQHAGWQRQRYRSISTLGAPTQDCTRLQECLLGPHSENRLIPIYAAWATMVPTEQILPWNASFFAFHTYLSEAAKQPPLCNTYNRDGLTTIADYANQASTHLQQFRTTARQPIIEFALRVARHFSEGKPKRTPSCTPQVQNRIVTAFQKLPRPEPWQLPNLSNKNPISYG